MIRHSWVQLETRSQESPNNRVIITKIISIYNSDFLTLLEKFKSYGRANIQLVELLNDAIALLGDVKGKFGLFEKQQYYKLVKRFEDHTTLPDQLHSQPDKIAVMDMQ